MRSKSNRMLVAFGAVLALSALTAGPALASGKPFVETKPATVVGEAWATLNGVVNANGAATKYYFEYGETTSYGKTTAQESAGAGATNLAESKAITGLMASKTYHFRIVATNSNGTTDGSDEIFSTKAAALPGLPEFKPSPGETLPASYTGTVGGAEWEMSGSRFECGQGNTTAGTIAGTKTIINSTLHFVNCRSGERRCTSENAAKEGEIITEPLEGTLVYRSKAGKTVGIDFKAQSGTAIVKLRGCLIGEGGEVRGSIVMPITSVNTRSSTFTLSAIEGREYENEKGEKKTATLETNWPNGVFSAMTWLFSANLTTSKNIEIKA